MTEEIVTDSLGNPKPPFRWSFSQWEVYSQCPQKWKFKNVMKIPGGPPGPAAARGLELHARVEDYINGKVDTLEHPDPHKTRYGDKLPAQVAMEYIPMLNSYRDHPNGDRYTEKKLAFDSEWYLCSYKSQFASCIAVLDAAKYTKPHSTDHGVLDIGEWKSGSPKDSHSEQRKLYAMFGMRAWLADEVRVTTYYLEGTAPPARLVLKGDTGFEKLKAVWNERVILMQKDEICAPRPSFSCRFCDYAKAKGGPCQFG